MHSALAQVSGMSPAYLLTSDPCNGCSALQEYSDEAWLRKPKNVFLASSCIPSQRYTWASAAALHDQTPFSFIHPVSIGISSFVTAFISSTCPVTAGWSRAKR